MDTVEDIVESSRTDILLVVLSRTASAAALSLVPDIFLVVAFRTDPDDDVVDVTSSSALDVVEIKQGILVVGVS